MEWIFHDRIIVDSVFYKEFENIIDDIFTIVRYIEDPSRLSKDNVKKMGEKEINHFFQPLPR